MIVLKHLPGNGQAIEEERIETFPRPRILTSGVFDGLHLAHQQLIRKVVEKARVPSGRGTAMVFTFSNHPLSVLAPPYAPKTLLTTARKQEILEQMGVDVLVMPPFTAELASTDPQTFVEEILVKRLAIDHLVVGYDFRFGKDGQGDTEFLKQKSVEFGFGLDVVSAVFHEEHPVSSTYIRDLIDMGRVRLASEILGRPYELEGPVVHGHGRGAQLGFPTANVDFDTSFAIPAAGVYAVYAVLNGQVCKGMMNIGWSPTFTGSLYRAEVFLFDFEKRDLYDETLRIVFIERIREERKFENVHALLERLRVDETLTRAILDSHPLESFQGHTSPGDKETAHG
jgi:riboflavin kinase/FMN adenylyltransferase